jgi:hypothetical protein
MTVNQPKLQCLGLTPSALQLNSLKKILKKVQGKVNP